MAQLGGPGRRRGPRRRSSASLCPLPRAPAEWAGGGTDAVGRGLRPALSSAAAKGVRPARSERSRPPSLRAPQTPALDGCLSREQQSCKEGVVVHGVISGGTIRKEATQDSRLPQHGDLG